MDLDFVIRGLIKKIHIFLILYIPHLVTSIGVTILDLIVIFRICLIQIGGPLNSFFQFIYLNSIQI